MIFSPHPMSRNTALEMAHVIRIDKHNIHLVWGDSRVEGVWYGLVSFWALDAPTNAGATR